MRHYIDRFKRGYAWEKEYGATTPGHRAALSLLFLVASFFMLAGVADSWIPIAAFAIGLVVMWVGVTINGSKWADVEEKREI